MVQIHREQGEPVALAVEGFASLEFGITQTDELLAELSAAGAPFAETAKSLRALWADTRARIEHALLSSLIAGLNANQAVTLADRGHRGSYAGLDPGLIWALRL